LQWKRRVPDSPSDMTPRFRCNPHAGHRRLPADVEVFFTATRLQVQMSNAMIVPHDT